MVRPWHGGSGSQRAPSLRASGARRARARSFARHSPRPESVMSDPEDRDPAPPPDGSRRARMATASLGGLLGGLVGGAVVLVAIAGLKAMMGLVSAEASLEIIVIFVPLLGLAVASLILHGLGRAPAHGASPDAPRASAWRTFPPDAVRADITGDVVDSAGVEDRLPWRLAPLRAMAIYATVGLGAAMGTEAPAA